MGLFYFLENVGLTPDYQNTIDFEGSTLATIQANRDSFWNSRKILSLTNENIRTIGSDKIIVEANYNTIKNVSYCCWEKTENGLTKKYYYFVISSRPSGVSQVELTLKNDVFMTYLGEYEIKESFVEREHQDRAIWDSGRQVCSRNFSTTDENIDVGENTFVKNIFKLESKLSRGYSSLALNKPAWVCLQYIEKPANFSTLVGYSCLTSAFFPVNIESPTLKYTINGINCLSYSELIKYFLNDPNVYSCNLLFSPPFEYSCDNNHNVQIGSGSRGIYTTITSVDSGVTYEGAVILPQGIYENVYDTSTFAPLDTVVADYIDPTQPAKITCESKLFCEPFTSFGLLYNSSFNKYSASQFKPKTIGGYSFDIKSVTSFTGPISEFYWFDYLKNSDNKLLINTTIPSVSENEIPLENDAWALYQNQNKASMRANSISDITKFGASLSAGLVSAASGNILGVVGSAAGIIGSFNSIQQRNAKYKDLKNQYSKVSNTGSSAFLHLYCDFINPQIITFRIDDEYFKKAYKYMLHFGYLTNEFKVPNIRSRYHYNFIKFVGANIVGNLNNEILEELKDAYNTGLTFWHYRDSTTFNFLDYSRENSEMNLINRSII